MLRMLEAVAALEPSHTKRSEEQIRLQQFSTPLPLAYAALQAAAIRPGDVVLEPSAGTGMLAVMAECALGSRAAGNLHLNEIADVRRALLCRLFPETLVTGVNAENAADRLPGARPTVVIMNPPFSATPGVHRIRHDADLRHLRSAFSMLPPGGRLAAVTSANCIPGDSDWNRAFGRLDPPARVVFTMAVDGRVYARRGTGFDTRLTVLDRTGRPGIDVDPGARAENAAELLDAVIARVPPRLPVEVRADHEPGPAGTSSATRPRRARRSERPRLERLPRPHPHLPMTGEPCPNWPSRPARRIPPPDAGDARLRTLRVLAGGRRPGSGRGRASDAPGAVRGNGSRPPSGSVLPPHAAGTRRHGRPPVGRPARKRRAGGPGP